MLEGIFFMLFFVSLVICASFGAFMECQESKKPLVQKNESVNFEESLIDGRPVEIK